MKRTNLIEPIFFAYMFCAFINSPLEEQLVYRKICLQNFNASFCKMLSHSQNKTFHSQHSLLQKQTSQFNIYSSLVKLIPAIFATIMFAMLFNRYGRKKILMFPIIGGILMSLNLVLNSYFMEWSVKFLLVGSFVDGIFGQFLVVLATVNVYVVDITSESSRSKRTVMLEAMIFLSGIIASPLSGIMLQRYGFFYTFVLVFCMYAFQIIYWIFLKESYPRNAGDNGTLSLLELFKKKLFLQPFRISLKKRKGGKKKMILILLTCLFLFAILIFGFQSVTVLYVLRSPINFSPSQIGYYFAELYGLQFIGASIITYVFLHRLKWSDIQVLLIFCAFLIISGLFLAFSNSKLMIFLSAICGLGLGVGPGAIRGKLSKLVEKEEQGDLFAFIAIFEVLLAFVFSIIFNAIYKATVDILPAFLFFALAGLSLVPTAIVVWLLLKGEDVGTYEELKEDENATVNENPIERPPETQHRTINA